MSKEIDELKSTVQKGPEAPLYFKGFFYGEYGTWKTVTSTKLSRRRALIVITDQGWTSNNNHPELVDNFDIVEYTGLSQLSSIAEWSKDPEFPYDIVIIDTISQIQEEYLDFLIEEITWSQNFREKSQVKRRGSALEGVEVPGRADYHVTRNKMRAPIKALMKAPVDVVFIAHLREPNEQDRATGNLQKRPSMTDTVYKLIAREASVMALFERDKGQTTVKCETDKKSVTKSRIKSLDGKTVAPNQFIELIHNWKDKK